MLAATLLALSLAVTPGGHHAAGLGNLDLKPPLRWKVYGDSYTIRS
ncbi:hypothetical protein [Nonomuraea coxensis]|nr:hypothetical protein [Nonomuraea coxensis]